MPYRDPAIPPYTESSSWREGRYAGPPFPAHAGRTCETPLLPKARCSLWDARRRFAPHNAAFGRRLLLISLVGSFKGPDAMKAPHTDMNPARSDGISQMLVEQPSTSSISRRPSSRNPQHVISEQRAIARRHRSVDAGGPTRSLSAPADHRPMAQARPDPRSSAHDRDGHGSDRGRVGTPQTLAGRRQGHRPCT